VSQNVNGGVFGGQIGYNWQVDPRWVLGLEADGQWTGERGRSNDVFGSIRLPLPGNDFNVVTSASASNETKLPWLPRSEVGLASSPTPACFCMERAVLPLAK